MAGNLVCSRLSDPVHAFGLALDLLFTRPPFRDYALGPFAATVKGQIKRGHYVFTFRDGVPVGYVGWALCEKAVARAWIERRRVPRHEECLAGCYWVGFVFCARDREVTVHQARYCRRQYPDHEFAYLREYVERQRLFDSESLAWRQHRRSAGYS
jgi:hemolysin-activating ACP:hemolysin acyltransferase